MSIGGNRLVELWEEARPHQRKYGNSYERFGRSVERESRLETVEELIAGGFIGAGYADKAREFIKEPYERF